MRLDPDDYDYDWFALDTDGFVGHFASAGSRLMPESVLESKERYDLVLEFMRRLPPIGQGMIVTKRKGRLTDFQSMASKGIHSFSCLSPSGHLMTKYKLIARPTVALSVDSIKMTEIIAALRATIVTGVRFSQAGMVAGRTIVKIGGG